MEKVRCSTWNIRDEEASTQVQRGDV